MTSEKKILGQWGEELAATFLREQGFHILQCNFQTRSGEIDIVAQEGEILCFVEVKTRQSLEYGPPVEAVSRAKQRTLIKVALMYLSEKEIDDMDLRFDVVTIDARQTEHPDIELIRDAIDCSFYF